MTKWVQGFLTSQNREGLCETREYLQESKETSDISVEMERSDTASTSLETVTPYTMSEPDCSSNMDAVIADIRANVNKKFQRSWSTD